MIAPELATAQPPAVDLHPARRHGRRNLVFALAVIAGYVLIAIIAFWPVLPWSSHRLFGVAADSVLAMWFLAWVPHALAHGLNPFFSQALFVPTGVNLAQNTEAPLLGLLTAPFAPFLSAVARANLLMVLAMPVSATAAFVVLRKWKVWGPAAALGGLIYGFSPYVVGQDLGHLVLVFIPLPPLIALTVVSILKRQGSPRRLGVQLGLLLSAQFLCEPEIFTSVVILSVWALLCAAIRFRRQVIEALRYALVPVAIAAAVSAVLLAYPIWMLLAGPQHYNGTAQPVINPYFNDLFSFVAPESLQRVSLGLHFSKIPFSNASEAGAFIGFPLLALAVFFVWRSWRSPRMQLAVAVFLGAAVLSLGPHLAVDGRLTHIRLPFLVFTHLPLLDNILASRFSLEVDACLGAIVAFGLDDLYRAPAHDHRHAASRPRRWAGIAAVVTLAVVVVTQLPEWPYTSQPAVPLPAQIRRAIPGGDPVAITYPYASPYFPQAMLWQAEDGFSFRLIGGYAEHPDPQGAPTGVANPMHPDGLELFLDGQEGYTPAAPVVPITPAVVAAAQQALSENDIRLVVVDRSVRGSGPVIELFTQALGPPRASTGSFALWSSRRGAL
jgi:hypothetical protein